MDDEELRKAQRGLRERVPFAVVGSNTVVEVDGKKIRGRRYPWGVVEGVNISFKKNDKRMAIAVQFYLQFSLLISGKYGALRLHRSAQHADPDPHDGSEGSDQQCSLRKLSVQEIGRSRRIG